MATDYTQDKAFLAAPRAEQMAYLKSVDSDFAKASDAEQRQYLDSISAVDVTNPEQMLTRGPGAPGQAPMPQMTQSKAPGYARSVTSVLPAMGAVVGGALASPGVVSTPAGVGLGTAAGSQAEMLTNRALFGPDETNPVSTRGLLNTGENAAINAGTEGILGSILPTSNFIERNPNLMRGVARDVASKYVSPRLADAILPEAKAAAKEEVPTMLKLSGGPTGLEHEAVRAGQKSALRNFYRSRIPLSESPVVPPEAEESGNAAIKTNNRPTMPTSEGRPATWTNERVIELAKQGNRDAISQATKRGIKLPENVKFVGDAPVKAGGKIALPDGGDYPPPRMRQTFPAREPQYFYRGVGPEESEISGAHYDQASSSPDEAISYAKSKGGKVLRGDLRQLDPEDYEISGGVGMPNLIRFKKPIPSHLLETIPIR